MGSDMAGRTSTAQAAIWERDFSGHPPEKTGCFLLFRHNPAATVPLCRNSRTPPPPTRDFLDTPHPDAHAWAEKVEPRPPATAQPRFSGRTLINNEQVQ